MGDQLLLAALGRLQAHDLGGLERLQLRLQRLEALLGCSEAVGACGRAGTAVSRAGGHGTRYRVAGGREGLPGGVGRGAELLDREILLVARGHVALHAREQLVFGRGLVPFGGRELFARSVVAVCEDEQAGVVAGAESAV